MRDRQGRATALLGRLRWLAWLFVVSTVVVARAAVADPVGPSADVAVVAVAHARRIELTVVADQPCAPRLRDVLVEQLAGVASEILWSCRARLEQEELFRPASPPTAGVRVWIDVSSESDARLFLKDQQAERFVVRRLALSNGLDEVSREEIGQIVRFGALTLFDRPRETMTRTEVRAALSGWPAARPASGEGAAESQRAAVARPRPPIPREPAVATTTPLVRPTAARSLAFGPAWSVQAFSRDVPVVHELALGLSLGEALSLWTEAGYRLPTTYRDQSVSVELGAWAWRIGTSFRRRAGGWGAWGLGTGVGVNRISFAPGAPAADVDVAPAGHFFSITGRVFLMLDLAASAHVARGIKLFCDVATTHIHYDLRDGSGVSLRVLEPFGFMPGLALGLAWRS